MGLGILKNKANDEVVENLRILLSKAEAGELRGFAFFGEMTGSQFVTTSVGEYNRTKLLGLCEIFKVRVAVETLNESEELG